MLVQGAGAIQRRPDHLRRHQAPAIRQGGFRDPYVGQTAPGQPAVGEYPQSVSCCPFGTAYKTSMIPDSLRDTLVSRGIHDLLQGGRIRYGDPARPRFSRGHRDLPIHQQYLAVVTADDWQGRIQPRRVTHSEMETGEPPG